MGIIKKLKSKTVFLDTAPLIYYIEENRNYSSILNKLFLANSKGEIAMIEKYQPKIASTLYHGVFHLTRNK